MSWKPSWLENSSSPTSNDDDTNSSNPQRSTADAAWRANSSSNAHANKYGDSPSWLSEDIVATSDRQMTSLQVDGVLDPAESATITTTTTGAPQNGRPPKTTTTWSEFWTASFRRDARTLLVTILVIVIMNVPYIHWIMYPFTIFSTWIHELCHGLAAEMSHGNIIKLEIFPDTSGLCTFTLPAGSKRSAFVASAGYQGTAVIGMLLLLLRRTKRGPRMGTMAIAILMLLSVLLWVRNAFGIAFLLVLSLLLGIAAWWLSSWWIRNLYVVLGVTCALNAITSVSALFGTNQSVNGDEDVPSDAQAMADIQGGSHTMWALIWLFLALGLAFLGFIFAIPGPDEVADFTLCGWCQDLGCFYICNAQGRRFWTNTILGKPTDTQQQQQQQQDATTMPSSNETTSGGVGVSGV